MKLIKYIAVVFLACILFFILIVGIISFISWDIEFLIKCVTLRCIYRAFIAYSVIAGIILYFYKPKNTI